jgi:hypothetical protein
MFARTEHNGSMNRLLGLVRSPKNYRLSCSGLCEGWRNATSAELIPIRLLRFVRHTIHSLHEAGAFKSKQMSSTKAD